MVLLLPPLLLLLPLTLPPPLLLSPRRPLLLQKVRLSKRENCFGRRRLILFHHFIPFPFLLCPSFSIPNNSLMTQKQPTGMPLHLTTPKERVNFLHLWGLKKRRYFTFISFSFSSLFFLLSFSFSFSISFSYSFFKFPL